MCPAVADVVENAEAGSPERLRGVAGLRSIAGICAWVRTPQLASLFDIALAPGVQTKTQPKAHAEMHTSVSAISIIAVIAREPCYPFAAIAQLGERQTEDLKVPVRSRVSAF